MPVKKFKKGDRVEFIDQDLHIFEPRWYPEVGTIGEVVSAHGDGTYIVQWPEGKTACNGRWAIGGGSLKLSDKPMVCNKIVITQDKDNPRKVVAKDYSTGEEAIARCNPEDDFDFHHGACLAFARLLGYKEKTDNLWNGRIICTKANSPLFRKGVIYRVVDGEIIGNDGNRYPSSFKTNSKSQYRRITKEEQIRNLLFIGITSTFEVVKGEA